MRNMRKKGEEKTQHLSRKSHQAAKSRKWVSKEKEKQDIRAKVDRKTAIKWTEQTN